MHEFFPVIRVSAAPSGLPRVGRPPAPYLTVGGPPRRRGLPTSAPIELWRRPAHPAPLSRPQPPASSLTHPTGGAAGRPRPHLGPWRGGTWGARGADHPRVCQVVRVSDTSGEQATGQLGGPPRGTQGSGAWASYDKYLGNNMVIGVIKAKEDM